MPGSGIGTERSNGEATAVIQASGLRVILASPGGPVEALRGLDLRVPKGSLFVLLGPNGAGKTTFMRCITGLVAPASGSISVFADGAEPSGGTVPVRARLARMGVLIENPGQYARLDAQEYLAFFGSFYAVPDLKARIRGLCAELGLDLDGKPVAKLSQGNRQKLQLARSLLHRPELLLWDEPTDHLDPVSQRQVLAYLRGYLEEYGATALVATHRLEQLEGVGTHFGFMAHGQLKGAGPRARILDDGPEEAMGKARIGFAREVRPEDLAWLGAAFQAGLEFPPGAGNALEISGAGLRFRMPELIKALVDRGFPVASAEPQRATLADVYQRLVES